MKLTYVLGLGLAAIAASAAGTPATALPMRPMPTIEQPASVVETVAVRRRTTVVRGPHGGVAASRTVTRGPAVRPGARPVVRPGTHPVVVAPRPGVWVRPANYWWRPGAAVAAGAAIGVVTAATAAAWAGSAPAPGYCWYYTDPSRRQGFWDKCP